METIVTEIIEIIKSAGDSVAREEALRHYFEEKERQWVSEAMERIDEELARQYRKNGWQVERRDRRTIQASYGTVTVKRRRMTKEGEEGIYPLDKEMGIRKHQRYTPYLEYIVAKVGAKSVYRTTAEAVSTLTPVTVSHQQVMNIVKRVGKRYEEWETARRQAEPAGDAQLRKPETLYIEGDGLLIRGQGNKPMEIHRFQIAEGIEQNGKRRKLIGTHYVADTSGKTARETMGDYLSAHYDLTDTIVLSNSDGGAGYEAAVFEEILGKVKKHEHFRDRYHANRKCRERLGWAGKDAVRDMQQSMGQHDWDGVERGLAAAEAAAQNEQQKEHVQLLRGYLTRNWPYLTPPGDRGLEPHDKGLGTCESNHRAYSYRMKKQGRRWGKAGGKAMVKILTGLKNGDLWEALAAREEHLCQKPGTEFRYAVRDALKNAKHQEHEGVRHGRIVVDAPSSSAIGQLARCIA